MVKLNAVASVSDSNAPQVSARKDNTIDFVKVLSQFPTYTYKDGNGWMVVKDICDKSGHSNTTHFTSLVVDNKDELVTLKGAELEEFKKVNEFVITPSVITKSKLRNLTIIGPNAFVEAVNRSTIQYFKSVREQSKDVLLRYIKGEEVSIKKDLETTLPYADDPYMQQLQIMMANRQKVLEHDGRLDNHDVRLESIEKKLSDMDESPAKYDNGQLTEYEYYSSKAKQIINDIVSTTKMSFQDVYHGVMNIFTTMPHYCKKDAKKSIFQTMESREDKNALALYYLKAAKMFKEKVS